MASETEVLIVAFKLAMLTFYTGVLVYALPIPWRPLKRWAPILIWDSVAAAVVSLLFYFLVDMSNRVAQLIGGSWEFFDAWFGVSFSFLAAVKAAIIYVTAVFSALGKSVLAKRLLSPIDTAVNTSLFTVFWVAGIAYFVRTFGSYLAAVGVALYAIPFRLTRGAGAWLLAFYLVFNAGLQVMPVLMGYLAEQPGGPNPGRLERYGLSLARLEVVDAAGHRVEGGVLLMRVPPEGEVASTMRIVNGVVRDSAGGSLVSVPSRADHAYILEVNGVAVYLTPYPTRPVDYDVDVDGVWKLTLHAPNIVWADYYVVAFTSGSVESVDRGNVTSITVALDAGDYVAVRYPSACLVDVEVDDRLSVERGSWVWRNLAGEEVRGTAVEEGEYTVTVNTTMCNPPDPKVRVTSYLYWALGISDFIDLNPIAAMILYYVTVPFLYVFLLLSATAGVARALGGRDRLPIRL